MTSHQERVLHQAASLLLAYPGGDLALVRDALEAAPSRPARLVRPFLDFAVRLTPHELAAHYVEVFDFKNRHSLYLSWWSDGDTRRRGVSLVAFKQAYRAHGLRLSGEELPDFLPIVLEFTAATGDTSLLLEHRPGLELLRLALEDAGTPYAHVLAAVCATLPGPSPKDRAQARALARNGPPREDVGLRPYGHLDLLPVLSPGSRR